MRQCRRICGGGTLYRWERYSINSINELSDRYLRTHREMYTNWKYYTLNYNMIEYNSNYYYKLTDPKSIAYSNVVEGASFFKNDSVLDGFKLSKYRAFITRVEYNFYNEPDYITYDMYEVYVSSINTTKGTYIDTVTSPDQTEYPDDGVLGDYWYIKVA